MFFLTCKYLLNIDSKEFIISWITVKNGIIKRYTEVMNLIISNMRNCIRLSSFVILFLFQCANLCPRQLNTYSPNQSLSNVKFKGDIQSDGEIFRNEKPSLRQELISMGNVEEDIQRSQLFLFFALILTIFLCLLIYTIYKRYRQRGEDIRMLQNSSLSMNRNEK